MAVTHQHLPLEQVRPGMILSDVLLDAHGQVLLPQGAVLTENMTPEAIAAQQAADSERLAYLFRKHDPDDPLDAATTLLRSYVTAYRLGTGEAA